MNTNNPHIDQPVLSRGPVSLSAATTLVMIHGRGASAESILSLYDALERPDVAAVAPQAVGGTWYPQSFLAPIEANQPYLDSALAKIDAVVTDLLDRGVPSERIALLGFSQGACLASEYLARHPRRYGGAMILTGGVIGPAGTARNYAGSLAGTPIFMGTSEPDMHVPSERVDETKAVFEKLGGVVELRRYRGMPHTINQDELDACRNLIASIAPPVSKIR